MFHNEDMEYWNGEGNAETDSLFSSIFIEQKEIMSFKSINSSWERRH